VYITLTTLRQYPDIFLEELDKPTKKILMKIDHLSAEVRTGDLTNKNQK
jgi:hypothetical protein